MTVHYRLVPDPEGEGWVDDGSTYTAAITEDVTLSREQCSSRRVGSGTASGSFPDGAVGMGAYGDEGPTQPVIVTGSAVVDVAFTVTADHPFCDEADFTVPHAILLECPPGNLGLLGTLDREARPRAVRLDCQEVRPGPFEGDTTTITVTGTLTEVAD